MVCPLRVTVLNTPWYYPQECTEQQISWLLAVYCPHLPYGSVDKRTFDVFSLHTAISPPHIQEMLYEIDSLLLLFNPHNPCFLAFILS